MISNEFKKSVFYITTTLMTLISASADALPTLTFSDEISQWGGFKFRQSQSPIFDKVLARPSSVVSISEVDFDYAGLDFLTDKFPITTPSVYDGFPTIAKSIDYTKFAGYFLTNEAKAINLPHNSDGTKYRNGIQYVWPNGFKNKEGADLRVIEGGEAYSLQQFKFEPDAMMIRVREKSAQLWSVWLFQTVDSIKARSLGKHPYQDLQIEMNETRQLRKDRKAHGYVTTLDLADFIFPILKGQYSNLLLNAEIDAIQIVNMTPDDRVYTQSSPFVTSNGDKFINKGNVWVNAANSSWFNSSASEVQKLKSNLVHPYSGVPEQPEFRRYNSNSKQMDKGFDPDIFYIMEVYN